MSFKIVFDELRKYTTATKKFPIEYKLFLKKFLTQMGLRVLKHVKPLTPVGKTGDLRKHWELGKIIGSGEDIGIEILNGMEYASWIEEGHRIVNSNGETIGWFEGRYMLKISMDYVRKQMPKRYKVAFDLFCKEKHII